MADTTIESNIAFTQIPNQPDDDEHFQHDDPWLDAVVEQVHNMFLRSHDLAILERTEDQVGILC